MLVTLPETTPVNELVETAYALEDRVGVRLGSVVVNAVDGPDDEDVPDAATVDLGAESDEDRAALVAASAFRRARRAMQAAELERLGRELALDQLLVPLVPVAGMTAAAVDALAAGLGPVVA